ncbi:MAG: protease modulator HflC [Gammaproteobacteria bacterium]|nr:protease modulator HflC [Gammaproteobacteria bacterium]
MSPKTIFSLIIVGGVLSILSSSLYVVQEVERGVKLRFKEVVDDDLEPGLALKIPFVEQVMKFDGRVQVLDAPPEEYLTQEKKRLLVDSYITWKISNVKNYYTSTGGGSIRNASRLLAPRVNNGLRDKFGLRTVHEVVSGEREELMVELTSEINQFTEDELGITILDVRVKKIELPAAASEAVYARMRAERNREAREYRSTGKELAEGIRADADRQERVIRAEAYRDAEKVRGEGDALASGIYADAYSSNSEFYSFYRSLDAYRKSFSSKDDLIVLKPDSEFFGYMKASKPN